MPMHVPPSGVAGQEPTPLAGAVLAAQGGPVQVRGAHSPPTQAKGNEPVSTPDVHAIPLHDEPLAVEGQEPVPYRGADKAGQGGDVTGGLHVPIVDQTPLLHVSVMDPDCTPLVHVMAAHDPPSDVTGHEPVLN
jgi:hypothetical protein